ncbi:MAG TPA: hypothetical protein VMW35_17600 [Myxococcota bacterium]|jgi:hypothetical protein|nr:hypothetical protein [Myxococcota bacterium]
MEPSVKGIVVRVAVEQVRDLLRRGVAREADLEKLLGAEGAKFVREADVSSTTWYPAPLYDALLRFLMATLGRGRPDCLIESGRQAAEAIAEKGIYSQFDRKAGGDAEADPRVIQMMTTLSKAIYSFTTWSVGEVDFAKGRFEIWISDAAAYPDSFMWRNVGFLEVMTSRATGEAWKVTCERHSRERIRLVATRRAPPAPGG